MDNKDSQYNQEEEEFFKKVEIPYRKSKEDIWKEQFEGLTEERQSSNIEMKVEKGSRIFKLAIAASLTLLIGLTAFFRFYSISYESGMEILAHTLPDGSIITMRAGSHVDYHPYWWSFDRKLNFEGEAFFEVEKGSKFSVESSKGSTEVLGTSFNINSHAGYEVYCKTGKVKVSTPEVKTTKIITPGQMLRLESQELKFYKVDRQETVLAWMNKAFYFENESIKQVWSELERTYQLEINYSGPKTLKYTGSFPQFDDPEEVLRIICTSYNFEYQKDSGRFKIFSK